MTEGDEQYQVVSDWRTRLQEGFALLPTVDHVGDASSSPDFLICSWRTSDAKSDLELGEFLTLCRRVLKHRG